MSSTTPTDPGDTRDIDAEDTPIGQMILERPEVRDVSLSLGHECAVIHVLFETWSIPSDFARQYDMHLASAGVYDDRPRWKRIIGMGRRYWLEGRFVRNSEVSVDE